MAKPLTRESLEARLLDSIERLERGEGEDATVVLNRLEGRIITARAAL